MFYRLLHVVCYVEPYILAYFVSKKIVECVTYSSSVTPTGRDDLTTYTSCCDVQKELHGYFPVTNKKNLRLRFQSR